MPTPPDVWMSQWEAKPPQVRRNQQIACEFLSHHYGAADHAVS